MNRACINLFYNDIVAITRNVHHLFFLLCWILQPIYSQLSALQSKWNQPRSFVLSRIRTFTIAHSWNWIERRTANLKGLRNFIVQAMKNILERKLVQTVASTPSQYEKRRCHSCCKLAKSKKEKNIKLAKKTAVCSKCQKYACGKHSKKSNKFYYNFLLGCNYSNNVQERFLFVFQL